MAFQHPRLLAVSLTIALSGASCSAPIAPPEQDPHTIAEHRREALVALWLDNARKLRAGNDLEAAQLELLKAKEMSPRNRIVAAELAEVVAELAVPTAIISWHGEPDPRLLILLEKRARARLQEQLQKAQKCISDMDYAGAIEELRRAALAIEIKEDIDWGDLPAQVQESLDKAKRLKDAQARKN